MPGRIAGKYLDALNVGHTPQIFVGRKPAPEFVQPIFIDPNRNKPLGGIWTSSYTGIRDRPSAWFNSLSDARDAFSPPVWLVEPRKDLNVLRLNDDIITRLPTTGNKQIDYLALKAAGIDAVHYPELIATHPMLGTVDVESTAWIGDRFPFINAELLIREGAKWKPKPIAKPVIDDSENFIW